MTQPGNTNDPPARQAAAQPLPQPLHLVRPPAPEDVVRADLYALLARLFYAGPDAAVLAAIVSAQDLTTGTDAPLASAWRALQAAAAAADAVDVTSEYIRIFAGVGKAPISIYASHYLTENYKELTLVHLRDELARLGLARKPDAVEPEDHLAGLLDVMHHLVRRAEGDFTQQAGFFNSYLAPWHVKFCGAIEAGDAPPLYQALSRLMRHYFAIEVEYFEWTV